VTPFDLSVLFFFQMAFILTVCRLMGALFVRLGQSRVVSEMIAGVVMGPSLMGLLFPAFSAWLFPPESRPVLITVAQLGLVLYMFLVGTEFDLALIRARARTAAAVSLAGILAPFLLGMGLAALIADDARLFPQVTTRTQAMLFLGAAMAITAFPMLARIIVEQGLSKTSMGTLVLAAGSIDDAVAWCVLAVVLASFKNDPMIAVIAIGGGLAFAIFTLTIVRRLLVPLGARVEREQTMTQDVFLVVLLLAMLGAWFTDIIQIYAVFGAFIMGAAMPRGRFTTEIHQRLHPLTVTFLLPVFFVYSGLNTKISLVNTVELWLITLAVLLVAITGKGVACYGAARLGGESHRDAMAIGTLMNARGLMELIILNIGLQRGIIAPTLFTIMVIMAIVTTLMATPVFRWVYGIREAKG
jgi:Kef-type K+ transport system membrane component KefB